MTTEERTAEFARRVRSEAKRKGVGMEQVFAGAKLKRSTFFRWMGGEEPSLSGLAALAHYFGCSMDYLWSRVDERKALYGGDPTSEIIEPISELLETLRSTQRRDTSSNKGGS